MYSCDCGENFIEKASFDRHQIGCLSYFRSCELCNEKVPKNDIGLHLFHCGSKTNQCPNCGKYIRRSIFNYHRESNCTFQDEDEPEVIRQQILDREPRAERQQESIPCEFCHEQVLWDEFQSHSRHCSSRKNLFNTPRLIREISTDCPEAAAWVTTDIFKSVNENQSHCSKGNAVTCLRSRADNVCDRLSLDYYPIEVNHVSQNLQFNVIVIGSPRVGKSQLINALCGEANLAETSPSLNSCTKDVKCYTMKDNQQRTPGVEPFLINFFDTPGIESWTEQNGLKTMLKFIEDKNPICVIFCASPGCFADLAQLRPVLNLCQEKKLLCALVCTNMWAGPNRNVVIDEFKRELVPFGQPTEKWFDQGSNSPAHLVTLFGHGALCTMVNSTEYYFPDLSPIRKPVQGVDELIQCIMDELDQEKLLGWCCAVLYRRSFWEKISQRVGGFYQRHSSSIRNLFNRSNGQTTQQIVKHLSGSNP